MDYDLQDYHDSFQQFKPQDAKAESYQTTTPALQEDQTQLSFCDTTFDAVKVPQSYTFDGFDFSVNTSLETWNQFSTTNSCIDLTTPNFLHEEFDTVSFNGTVLRNNGPNSYVETDLRQSLLSTEKAQNQFVPEELASKQEHASIPIKVETIGNVNNGNGIPSITPKAKVNKNRKYHRRYVSEWNCELCERSFRSKGGLKQHNSVYHSGPAPHICSICSKRFRDSATMQQHIERHSMKNKPFKCQECPKQFMYNADLVRHFNVHHWKSPHNCDICGRTFGRADHLKDHLLCHAHGTTYKLTAQKLNQAIF